MSRWPGRLITKTPVTPSGPGPTAAAPGVWTLPEVAYWNRQGLWPSAGADPYWSYVSYLLGTTSTNTQQNNTFLDSSTNNFTITRNGNTTQGAFTPYGTLWSNYFDGSSYLSTPNNAAFQFNTGDFTVECWVNKPAASNGSIVDVRSGGTGAVPWAFYVDGSNFPYFYDGTSYTSSVAITSNAWNHIAVVRTSGVLKIFVNGVQGYSAAHTVSLNATGSLSIGGTAAYSMGYISNLRIVKGTAVYTSAFTPPAVPLTAISGTSLLTCQSNRFLDNSTNSLTITANGNTAVSSFSPFVLAPPGYDTSVNGGSGYFDGSGDYLTAPANAAFQVSGGDFTLETWFYMTALPAANASGSRAAGIFMYSSGFGGGYEFFVDMTNNVIQVSQPGGGNATYASYTFSLNTWYHVAFSRASGTNRIFVNGVSLTLAGNTFPNNATGSPTLKIGAGLFSAGYDHYFPGYLVDARIVKGTGVYTANFTPPTTPLTAITNTSLLLNFTNAGIFDASMNSDMETVGNAQVSSAQAKYGPTSAYFDGSGDYLSMPSSPSLILGSSNFTAEAWFYAPSTVSSTQHIMGSWDGSSTLSWTVGLGATNKVLFVISTTGAYNPAFDIISTATFSTGTWNHLAFVRNGSAFNLYLNGVSVASLTNSSALYSYPQGTKIGGNTNSQWFNGYLDDLRITNGYARYTANFTPPTAALPIY